MVAYAEGPRLDAAVERAAHWLETYW